MLACRFTEICQVMRGSVTIKLKAVAVVANGLLLSPRKKNEWKCMPPQNLVKLGDFIFENSQAKICSVVNFSKVGNQRLKYARSFNLTGFFLH